MHSQLSILHGFARLRGVCSVFHQDVQRVALPNRRSTDGLSNTPQTKSRKLVEVLSETYQQSRPHIKTGGEELAAIYEFVTNRFRGACGLFFRTRGLLRLERFLVNAEGLTRGAFPRELCSLLERGSAPLGNVFVRRDEPGQGGGHALDIRWQEDLCAVAGDFW